MSQLSCNNRLIEAASLASHTNTDTFEVIFSVDNENEILVCN